MIHFLVVTENQFGVLARITGVVSAMGTNIDTAAAYPVAGSDLSVVHLRIDVDRENAGRLRRKIERLIEVIEVRVDESESPLSIDLGRLIPASALGV